jgi:hypothetical protein
LRTKKFYNIGPWPSMPQKKALLVVLPLKQEKKGTSSAE